MKRWLWVTLAMGCLLLVSGCKPSVVGKWNVDTSIQGIAAKGTAEFKKDGTMASEFVTSAGGRQIPISIKGTWRMEQKDKKNFLTVRISEITAAGQKMPSALLGETTSEVTFGKGTFTTIAQDGSGQKVTYTKAD